MQKIVLFSVGVLYVFLGVWCTILPTETASALGYELNDMGRIEYIVVYGGLEWGLGLAMMLGALNSMLRPGVFFMTTVFSTMLPITRVVMLSQHGYNQVVVIMLAIEIVIALSLLASFFLSNKSVVMKI